MDRVAIVAAPGRFTGGVSFDAASGGLTGDQTEFADPKQNRNRAKVTGMASDAIFRTRSINGFVLGNLLEGFVVGHWLVSCARIGDVESVLVQQRSQIAATSSKLNRCPCYLASFDNSIAPCEAVANFAFDRGC